MFEYFEVDFILKHIKKCWEITKGPVAQLG